MDMRLVAGRTPTRITDDDRWHAVRGLRDGSVITADLILALALEGRVYSANVGSAQTPVSFAKTAYDADQPQLVIDVPANTAIIPLHARLALQDSAGTDNIWHHIATDVNVGAGTSTEVTPVNHNTEGGSPNSSAFSLYTGNGTDPTTGTERYLGHEVYAFADATTDPIKVFNWDWRDNPGTIVGAGAWVHYVVGTTTAPAGYAVATWAELPASFVSE